MRPRLFLQIVSVEARRMMTYRADFWITSIVGFVTAFGVAWFLWDAMFTSAGVETLGGFSFRAMVLYYVVVVLIQRLVRGATWEDAVSNDIYTGGLNRYLVFPIGYLPYKYAQRMGTLVPTFVQLVLFGFVFGLLVGVPDDVTITPWGALGALAAVAVGNLLYFLMSFPLNALAFWADNVWSLTVLLRMLTSLLGGALVPLTLFPGWAQEVLQWTPFPVLFHLPAQTLLGKVDGPTYLKSLAIALVWCGAMRMLGAWVWRRGNLRYSGVGL